MREHPDDDQLFKLIESAFWQIERAPPLDKERHVGPQRALRYLRRSIGDPDHYSTGVQNELISGYLKEIGAVSEVPNDVYIDRNRSGITIRDRSGLIRLIKRVVLEDVAIVVCSKQCRLTRNPRDAAWLEELFDRHGTEFHVVGTGRVYGLEMSLGAYESQESRKDFLARSSDGSIKSAELGRYIGSRQNYGYDRTEVRSDWIINETQAAIIRRCAAELDGKITPNKLATTLNREGIPPPRGKIWRGASFFDPEYGLLTRTLLIGLYTFEQGGRRVEIPKPELRILETDLFDRLQERYVVDRGSTDGSIRCGKYIAKSMRCACGAPMRFNRNSRAGVIQCSTAVVGGRCPNTWQLATAEATRSILLLLRDELFDPDRREEWDQVLYLDWELRMLSREPRRREIMAELERIDHEVDREPEPIFADLAPGFFAVRNRLEMEQIDLAEELDALDEPAPNPLLVPEEIADLREACSRMLMRLPETHFRDVEEAVLDRLREIVPLVILATDEESQRYETRLLLGLPGSAKSQGMQDASSPRWIVRSFPRPVKGTLRFPDTVLAHHRRAERGEFALSDCDWEAVCHLYSQLSRRGVDSRLIAEVGIFHRLTAVPLSMLPERYFGLAEEARLRRKVLSRMIEILRMRGSDHMRSLLRFYQPSSAPNTYANPAP